MKIRESLDQASRGLQAVVDLTVGVPHGLTFQPGHRRGEPAIGPDGVEGGEVVLAPDLAVDFTEGRGQVDDAGPFVGLHELPAHHAPAVPAGRARKRVDIGEGPDVVQSDQRRTGQAVLDHRAWAEHRLHEVDGHDVGLGAVRPVGGHHGVLETRADGCAGIGEQGPRCGGPCHQGEPRERLPPELGPKPAGRLAVVGQGQGHIGRFVLHRAVDVRLAQLVAGQCGPTSWAVRHHLDVLVQQVLVPQVLQVPPDRLHVLRREGPVGGIDVHPEPDPLGERLPLVHVVAHRRTTQPRELGDTHLLLDLALVGDPELALHLDLHREAVGVPAGPAGNRVAPHGPIAAEQVLVDPGPDMVEAGPTVGRRRPFVEHPGLRTVPQLDGALEDAVLGPSGELVDLQGGEISFGGHRAEQRVRPFGSGDGSDGAFGWGVAGASDGWRRYYGRPGSTIDPCPNSPR